MCLVKVIVVSCLDKVIFLDVYNRSWFYGVWISDCSKLFVLGDCFMVFA
jgi:hypothetical protein